MDSPKDTISKLISLIADEHQYIDYDADIQEISSNGANVTAVLFLVTLEAKDKEKLRLFAKVANVGENMRNSFPICPFTTEMIFYNEVLHKFGLLQKKLNVSEEHRLVFPKMYASNDQFLNETIVLEDLVARGFETHDRQKTIDLEYASAAIEVMAKFHALSFAYYKEDPEDFEKILEKLTFDMSVMEASVRNKKSKLIETAFEVSTKENKEKLEKYLAAEGDDKFVQFIRFFYAKQLRMLGHGDFKANNLMHRRRNNKLEIIPVDFQLVHAASPVADLMYFLFTASDEDFRRQHYHEMLEYYYEQLKLALGRLDVDPEEVYPEKQYREDLDEASMTGLMIAIIILPVVTMAEEGLPAGSTEFLVPGSELFRERFNGVVNNYREWGLL